MAEGLDTGDMLLTEKTPIAADETADTLHDRLAEISAQTLAKTLEMLENNTLKPVPQGEAGVLYAEKITKEMSRLDFTKSAAETDRTIRAVTGFAMLGGKRVKLHRSILTQQRSDLPAGSITDAKTLTFVCGDGCCVQPLVIQAEGSRAMPVQDFLRGFAVGAHAAFSSVP
jgi:methionyl-tRNA formyltransferase